MELSKVQ